MGKKAFFRTVIIMITLIVIVIIAIICTKIYQKNDVLNENKPEANLQDDNKESEEQKEKKDDENQQKQSSNGYQKVLNTISSNAVGNCSNTIIEENGVKYFAGYDDCIYYNFVWYSGKLWRIIALYSDGTMKLVTENAITAMRFSDGSSEFKNSYVYQWLNDDFLKTLYNYQNIIDNTKIWDDSIIDNGDNLTNFPRPNGSRTLTSYVGMLDAFEYEVSYRNHNKSTSNTNGTYSRVASYLFTYNSFYLLGSRSVDAKAYILGNPKNVSNKQRAEASGTGIRPAIYLKANLEFTGSGTYYDPFMITIDKPLGKSNELVNTRLSGEYVSLPQDRDNTYRIIEVDNSTTKIVSVKPIIDENLTFAVGKIVYSDDGYVIENDEKTPFNVFGEGRTNREGTYYYYLNNEWIKNLTYYNGDLFTNGKYYYGPVYTGESYKKSKGSKSNSLLVGIPQYGEMFSLVNYKDASMVAPTWLMTRFSSSNLYIAKNTGDLAYVVKELVQRNLSVGVKPTLYLKNTIKIKSGNGTKTDPYIVGL